MDTHKIYKKNLPLITAFPLRFLPYLFLSPLKEIASNFYPTEALQHAFSNYPLPFPPP